MRARHQCEPGYLLAFSSPPLFPYTVEIGMLLRTADLREKLGETRVPTSRPLSRAAVGCLPWDHLRVSCSCLCCAPRGMHPSTNYMGARCTTCTLWEFGTDAVLAACRRNAGDMDRSLRHRKAVPCNRGLRRNFTLGFSTPRSSGASNNGGLPGRVRLRLRLSQVRSGPGWKAPPEVLDLGAEMAVAASGLSAGYRHTGVLEIRNGK